MKRAIFLSMTFVFGVVFAGSGIDEIRPVANSLQIREPEWRYETYEYYEGGAPRSVCFFAQSDNGEEVAVKRMRFYPNGNVALEEDLDRVHYASEKGDLAAIPCHGLSVKYFINGIVQEVQSFDKGKKHGPHRTYYENGKDRSYSQYNRDSEWGTWLTFYENGAKESETHYKNGVLEGEIWAYYPNGKRKSMVTYEESKRKGYAYEWHENGVVSEKVHFVDDLVQDDGANPAVIVYDEFHAMRNVMHFEKGQPVDTHYIYHPNGQESDRIPFKDGKIHGVVKKFSETGTLLGEAPHRNGVRIGRHWIHYPSGRPKYIAEFDDEGNLLSPICEYAENGQQIAQYFIKDDAYEGTYKTWYDSGQLKSESVYENGQLTGASMEFYENGQPEKSYSYVEGKLEGKGEHWYEDGSLKFSANFAEGIYDGEVSEWHPNHERKSKGFYQKGEPHGKMQKWFANGSPEMDASYKHGEYHGSVKSWNEEGQLLLDAYYQKGVIHGTYATYYDDGKPKEVIEYQDGDRHGKAIEYWPNGSIKIKSFYQKNHPEGLAQGFFENGSLSFSRFYKGGLPVGEQKEFFQKSQTEDAQLEVLHRLANYNGSGKLHGEQKGFYPNGNIESIVTYEDGVLQGLKSIWDIEGHLIQESWYENGRLEGRFFQRDKQGREVVTYYEGNRKHGPFEAYYPEHPKYGKVKAIEATYVNGKLEGEMLEYSETGSKIKSTPYKNDKKEGVGHLFDPRGLLVLKVQFKNDLKEGDSIQYFPNGRVFKQIPYVKDQIHGFEKTYHPDGTLANQAAYENGQLHGLSQSWNEAGVLIFEGEYFSGKKHGKFNKYYDDGTPRVLQTYKDNELIAKENFDPEGNSLRAS